MSAVPNTIPAQEIKRCGISVVDEALKAGPVHIIKNNRPQYVVMSETDYARLVEGRASPGDADKAPGASAWDYLDRPTRGVRTREEIDASLKAQRASWGEP